MTMSRSVDELVVTKVIQVERAGRERLVTFSENRRAIWEDMLPRLRNPVSKIVRIFKNKLPRENVVAAGISALALRTMLNEPAYSEYAISRDAWKALEKTGIDIIPVEEPGTCLLQVWCYDPKILEIDDGGVDPFSLFLSLQNEHDERIDMALDKMMEQYL